MKINSKNQHGVVVETTRTGSRRVGPAFLNIFGILAVVAACALASGCASTPGNLAFDPVGPSPKAPAAAAANGTLVVYTASDLIPNLSAQNSGSLNSYYAEYSRYKIVSPEGTLLRSVENNAGTSVLHPRQIELPTGRYNVIARSESYGRLTVPVIIKSGQITVLHLDGEDFWPKDSAFNQTNTVRLPNGEIVGWKAGLADNAGTP